MKEESGGAVTARPETGRIERSPSSRLHPLMAELPDHELESFFRTAQVAHELARQGKFMYGQQVLTGALARAQEAEAGEEPWGAALAGRYRRAVDRYVERYELANEVR
jgi:hypothetical protein